MQLHQVNAIVDGRKTRANDSLTAFYQAFQRDAQHAAFAGIIRTYRPLDDQSTEKFPDERKNVQKSVASAIGPVLEALKEAFDTVAAQDAGNCIAKADVVVDGKVILKQVPVTTLLFLAKRLVDINTVIEKLPTLDPAEDWAFDETAEAYKSKPSESYRNKKVRKNHVKAEATKEHPAQVDTYDEDTPIGIWTTVKFSGAIPAKDKTAMLSRVQKLVDAVKVAREEANKAEAAIVDGWSAPFIDFIFEKK